MILLKNSKFSLFHVTNEILIFRKADEYIHIKVKNPTFFQSVLSKADPFINLSDQQNIYSEDISILVKEEILFPLGIDINQNTLKKGAALFHFLMPKKDEVSRVVQLLEKPLYFHFLLSLSEDQKSQATLCIKSLEKHLNLKIFSSLEQNKHQEPSLHICIVNSAARSLLENLNRSTDIVPVIVDSFGYTIGPYFCSSEVQNDLIDFNKRYYSNKTSNDFEIKFDRSVGVKSYESLQNFNLMLPDILIKSLQYCFYASLDRIEKSTVNIHDFILNKTNQEHFYL